MNHTLLRPVEQLVGRRRELAQLESAVEALEHDYPSVVTLTGEPGIGKSRLLAELARLAEERRYEVLAGRASELENDLPYWVFVDALDDRVQSLEGEGLPGELESELGRIFPALREHLGVDGTVLDERYRVHRAMRELLEQLAVEKPVVLVLDDLHWADPSSIELLSGLLRRPPQAHVLFALALRSPRLPSRLEAALEQAHTTTHRLELGPLSEEEARDFLGQWLEPQAAERVYGECGGNPFYLEQIAKNLRRSADVLERSDTLPRLVGDVPDAVSAALREELDSLRPRTRRFLEGAAVVGDPFEPKLAGVAAEASYAESLEALDELLELDLLRPTGSPRRFRFRHPLVRHAVYKAARWGWKLAAHDRTARALAERGEPVAVQAHHVEHSAHSGDPHAIELLRAAADVATVRAPASAARWYQAALELLPGGEANGDERIDLLVRLARVLVGMGRLSESRTALLDALELAPSEPGALRAQLTAACASVEHLLGRHDEAHARLVVTLGDLPDRNSAEAAALLLDLANDAFFCADHEGMRNWGLEALAAADPLGALPLCAGAHAAACLAEAFIGRIQEAQAHRDDASRIIGSMSDADLATRLDAVSHLVAAEIYLDRYADAVAHAERGLQVVRATGQGHLFPQLTQSKAVALSMLGRLDEAIDLVEGTIDAARLSNVPPVLAWALFNRCWVALLAGDLPTALRAGRESVDLVRSTGDSMLSPFVSAQLGASLIEAGDPVQGLDILFAAAGGVELPRIPGVWRVVYQEAATKGLLALRRLTEADESAARAERAAEALGLNLARATAQRARAAVLLAAGEAPAAARTALDSVDAAEAIHAPLEAARSRTLAGRALIALGDRARASVELEQAATEFDTRGVSRFRDEAERELRRLGRRHRRRSGSMTAGRGVASLTGRELEVAELVRRRMTNREIAAQLFLSEKTIETHLRHIFDKLGVASRASVGRVLEQVDSSEQARNGAAVGRKGTDLQGT
jgi:DNA-binding NarL/FixJ family response regulator/tetratricopeptide (TPR) repeat protein